MTLLYGLVTGALFGFLMQKARVIRYDRQMGALRLLDMTIVKFMFTAILTGMAGVYLLHDLGFGRLLYMPTVLSHNILGGLVFGAGWGLLGYCPGTALGALGEGRRDAAWGILGMLAGGALYAEAYPYISRLPLAGRSLGYVTVPQLLGIHHWAVIAVFVGVGLLLFAWFEKKGL